MKTNIELTHKIRQYGATFCLLIKSYLTFKNYPKGTKLYTEDQK